MLSKNKVLKNIFSKSQVVAIDEFIEKSLYNKKFGYYIKKNPFGSKGDFITAPLISFIFSEMIAIWLVSLWAKLNKPKNFNIIELGPGDGKMFKTINNTLKKFPTLYNSANFYLFEKSISLRKIQKKNINDKKVIWINNYNKIKKGPVIFFGNEFFDALPVKQFKKKKNKLFEVFVKLSGKLIVSKVLKNASKEDIKNISKFKTLKNQNFIEYPKLGFKELNKIIKKINKNTGGVLIIDYGFLKQENKDTLQSIKNHKRNEILENIGEADITSLVNFNLLKEYFKKNRLDVSKVVNRNIFLKKLGILERAEILSIKMDFKEKVDLYLRVKRLLDNKNMGSLFKVVFASKLKCKKILGFY